MILVVQELILSQALGILIVLCKKIIEGSVKINFILIYLFLTLSISQSVFSQNYRKSIVVHGAFRFYEVGKYNVFFDGENGEVTFEKDVDILDVICKLFDCFDFRYTVDKHLFYQRLFATFRLAYKMRKSQMKQGYKF